MKKLISLLTLGATTSLMAMYSEHAYLYKDPRIMGMGGANVAVGSYSTSVFYNPAGLNAIEKDEGFVVDLLGLGVSVSDKTQDFISDVQDASDAPDAEQTAAMTDVLNKYSGEHFHVGVDNYTSISKHSDAFAWSVGLLAAVDANFMAHGNGSAAGGFLETTSRGYGGLILGGAKELNTPYGHFDIGIGAKYITQKSVEGTLGASELTDDNASDILRDKYEKDASGYGIDLGVVYKPLPDNFWQPAVGLSILNIGDMSMDDNYGGQPTTVNLGVSVTPKLDTPFIEKLTVALDYVDLFNANTTRIYQYTDDGSVVSFNDYTDADMMKRIRFGTNVNFIDSTYFHVALNAGMYQAAYTAGLELRVSVLNLNVSTYQEQVGVGSVDIADRRWTAQLGIGW